MLEIDADAERVTAGRGVDEPRHGAGPQIAAEDVAAEEVTGVEGRTGAGRDALGRGGTGQDDRMREGRRGGRAGGGGEDRDECRESGCEETGARISSHVSLHPPIGRIVANNRAVSGPADCLRAATPGVATRWASR
jgi:hypothetical protein